MVLSFIDYLVIFLFFSVIFGISFYYSKLASKGTDEFFLSGRNLPWYLAGTAMVATTFAADTPLAVTELVAMYGVSGNWVWWNMAMGGLLTTFFFARLWRRSGVKTDLEFIELRYSGRTATILRGFRAIYLGLLLNAIVLGWVHKAMEKIFKVVFPDLPAFGLVVILALVIGLYSAFAGLVGTIRTDSFQFFLAISGCIVLAVLVLRIPEIGGLAGLEQKLPEGALSFFPKIDFSDSRSTAGGVLSLTSGAFIAFVGLQWWSSWYPGSDPGGGGYVAQRMLSTKDEKQSLLATLWFNIAHYTIRPWPWILVALCAIVLLPRSSTLEELETRDSAYFEVAAKQFDKKQLNADELIISQEKAFSQYYEDYENTRDPGLMYPKLMVAYLPSGVLGLLLAVFLAAYMSTVASQLNWGSSYLFNDFYLRFIRSDGSASHNVMVSRLLIILMITFSLFVTYFFLETVSGAWLFILNTSAGMGAVLILRWYWWRINAWSEIASIIAPMIIYPVSQHYLNLESPLTLFPTVIGTTVVWLLVTFLTAPEKPEHLKAFVEKVNPGGWGWSRFADSQRKDHRFGLLFQSWVLSILAVYSAMYGLGKLLFGGYLEGLIALGIFGLVLTFLLKNIGKGSL